MSNLDKIDEISQIARLAVLAMVARGCAVSEFDGGEVQAMRITITNENGTIEPPIDVEFMGRNGMPVGGMSL